MPHYFFEVANRHGLTEDLEGASLPEVAAAREHALAAVRSILSDESRRGLLDLRGRIRVRDRDGATLFTLPFAEAVDIRTGPPPGDGLKPGIDHD